MRASRAFRGGLFIMSKSGGLKPRAVAGKPSVTRLTHSSWTGMRASGKPTAAVRKMLETQKKQRDEEQWLQKSVCVCVCLNKLIVFTKRLLQHLKKSGIWWTVSCCYKWPCLPPLQPQWWQSCHRPAPSQRRSLPRLSPSPWRCRSQPSSEQEHRSLRHQSDGKKNRKSSIIITLFVIFVTCLECGPFPHHGCDLIIWLQVLHNFRFMWRLHTSKAAGLDHSVSLCSRWQVVKLSASEGHAGHVIVLAKNADASADGHRRSCNIGQRHYNTWRSTDLF